MYISGISIENFRNFNRISMDFQEGMTIITGPCGSGKSNLLAALGLIFDPSARRQLKTGDFYQGIGLRELQERPPVIRINITLTESEGESLMGDELAMVSRWLVAMEEPYKARLHYEFFLPGSETDSYRQKAGAQTGADGVWDIIERDFIRLYTYRIWGGNPENQMRAEAEELRKFDYQLLVPDRENGDCEMEEQEQRLLIQQEFGIELPSRPVGSGHHSLLSMAALLNRMQKDSDQAWLKGNARVFPFLAVEEAEAHLSPGLQRKVVSFLRKSITDKKVKQILITTHSPFVAEEAGEGELIYLHQQNGRTEAVCPDGLDSIDWM